MLDLLIKGGFLLTMDPQNRVITKGAIGIQGDTIVKIGQEEEFAGIEAVKVIDATDKIIMPGLIDTHGHAGHGLIKTIGEGLPGLDWLRLADYIYFEHTTEDYWYAEALLSGLERLKFGTTCGHSMLGSAPRIDDPIYADRHAEGMREVGIRDIIGIGPPRPKWPRRFVQLHNGEQGKEVFVSLSEALVTIRAVLDKWHGKDKHTYVQVNPSQFGKIMGDSVAEVQDLFRKLMDMVAEYKTKLHAHVYAGDVKFAYQHLEGVLGPDTIAAHATGIDNEELQILAQTGTNVSSSPSARAVCIRRCPVPELMQAGVNVTLASDAASPDRTFDLFKELKVAMIQHRSHFKDLSYLPAGRVLRMVTIDAAKALGLDSCIGSLEVNKQADIILLNLNQPHLVPKLMAPLRVAYEATGHDVSDVIVAGKVLMENRQVLTVDEQKVIDLAQREAEKMIRRAGIEDLLEPPEGFWEGVQYKYKYFTKEIGVVDPEI